MFYKVEISAETLEDSRTILDALLAQKLVTGGQFFETPSRFLWKGETPESSWARSCRW